VAVQPLDVAETTRKLSPALLAPLQKNSLGGTTCQAGVVWQRRLGHLSLTTAVWAAALQHLQSMPPLNCHWWGAYRFAVAWVIPCRVDCQQWSRVLTFRCQLLMFNYLHVSG